MWSIYDTMILVSGLIVLAVAILPVQGIPQRTRVVSGLVGGGLILLSLLLGSLSSFSYPRMVLVGPLIALAAAGGILAQARKLNRPGGGDLQVDETAHGSPAAVPPSSTTPILAPGIAPSQPRSFPADDPRLLAWVELHQPATTPSRLAEIVVTHPEFGTAVLQHPNVYPELREWIVENIAAPS